VNDSDPSPDRSIIRLGELALEEVTAHGGAGQILFNRVLEGERLQGQWNFVDYAVLPPGSSIGIHTHGKNEELYLVLEGEGLMHRDGREFRVGPGSVVLNRPGGTHGLRNDGENALRLFVVEVRV
jgi:mannose-6-phosphate isomerase-like protein (cupin superfamily)